LWIFLIEIVVQLCYNINSGRDSKHLRARAARHTAAASHGMGELSVENPGNSNRRMSSANILPVTLIET